LTQKAESKHEQLQQTVLGAQTSTTVNNSQHTIFSHHQISLFVTLHLQL